MKIAKTQAKTTKSKVSVKKPKTKKAKKSRYKTGIHKSPKCIKPIEYRSGWEKTVAIIFDSDPDVLCYSYESIGIPYRSPNLRSTKIRRYFPDFFVTYTDGRKVIIEVKRDDKIDNVWTQTKAKACIVWAEKSGITFQIWGSKQIAEQQMLVQQKIKQMLTGKMKKPQ